MTLHSDVKYRNPILVFLARNGADVILSQLKTHGYMAVAVYTIPELFDALRSGGYALVVTTRPGIAMVRNIKLTPVLNLEVFFYDVILGDGSVHASKQFDGKAFMERIQISNVPRSTRKSSQPDLSKSGRNLRKARRTIGRWWRAAKSSFCNRAPVGEKQ
ncbi:hypothetical protein [Rhizobium tumorigenes]|uniref:Uncharacterized protein n=1 Tax=Rhizobium tumorigenes TaxID=2041385 RepID=A0AAF1KGT1_9HYPH|nr:hypothetical protein [Rhizobium tumorigenes]WFR98012.1 hypothetical protein PR017_19190 [Rhizobium tumorigenes]